MKIIIWIQIDDDAWFGGNVNIIDERDLNKYLCDLIFGIATEKIILDRTIHACGYRDGIFYPVFKIGGVETLRGG